MQTYDNATTVSNENEILLNFKTRSLACYKYYPCIRDIQYAAHKRSSLDLFRLERAKTTVVFIHGGYWQWCNKSDFAFIAPPILDKNCQCVLLEYDLAPSSTMQQIVAQIRLAFDFLLQQTWITDEVIVIGHSAGAHLAALMQDHPLVSKTILLSGIYDLAPIAKTTLNQALKLSDQEIQQYSPIEKNQLFNKACEIFCGDQELAALKWQSEHYYQQRLQNGETLTRHALIKDSNHYNIIDHFLDNHFLDNHFLDNHFLNNGF